MNTILTILILFKINFIRVEARNRGILSTESKYQPLVIILQDDSADAKSFRVSKKETVRNDNLNIINNENSAYILYHMLRTTQDTGLLDPEVDKEFEATRSVLRQSFRSKCERFSKCLVACEENKLKNACNDRCKKKEDIYSNCDDPEKKRGLTLPPRWEKDIYC